MSLISRLFVAGRRWRHSWALALVLALTLFPAMVALAFYVTTSTGSGSVGTVTAAAPPVSTVSIGPATTPEVWNVNGVAAGSNPSIQLGDVLSFNVKITCLTGCPAAVASIHLSDWSSNHPGCTSALLPGSFTMTPDPTVVGGSASTSGLVATVSLKYNNLAIDQSACIAAVFTFNFTSN